MTIHFADSTSIDSGGSLGKVLQVVSATKNDQASFNHSTSVLSNLEGVFDISITPSSSSNKVLVRFSLTVGVSHNISCLTVEFLDSPNTTSACKYYLKLDQMTGTLSPKYLNRSNVDTNANSYARGTCHAIAMEVEA